IKIRNSIDVLFQHLAIARQSNPPTIVVHVIMNELSQAQPLPLVQAGYVVPVDGGKVRIHHGCRSCVSARYPVHGVMASQSGSGAPRSSDTALWPGASNLAIMAVLAPSLSTIAFRYRPRRGRATRGIPTDFSRRSATRRCAARHAVATSDGDSQVVIHGTSP